MNVAQAKAYLLLAIAELSDAVDPAQPSQPASVSGQTLVTYGQVVVSAPQTIQANFDQRVRILAMPMAGGGGKNVSLFLAIDGGELKQGNRWEDIPPGAHNLYFTGGQPGVQYAVNAIPA